jgi:acetyltransferase-like isoleucine patch superfamily enzyme
MSLVKKIKSRLFKRHRDRAQLGMVCNVDRIVNLDGNQVAIGKFTYGVENIQLLHHPGCPQLSIGRYCSIGHNVTIFLGAYHRHDWISTYPFSSRHQNTWQHFGEIETPGFPKSKGPVQIGNDVWIGHAAMIMSGVTIGDGAVIAAGAHVVRDVLPYEIVGGNPAKNIGFRFAEDVKDKLMKIRWWEFPDALVKEIAAKLSNQPDDSALDELLRLRLKL